jgi:hypothetical protein
MASAITAAFASTFAIPSKKMQRRQDSKTLGDIFEKDDKSKTPKYFNASLRRDDGLKYRIPEHQRHPSWKKEKKQLLVDTVFRNYPMSGFVVSEHCENNDIYYDIEDGQSRLSILQEFYNDGFTYETETGQQVKFSQLSNAVQRQFENYKIYIEVMSDFKDNAQYEVFERLQNGEALADKDLYWNRRDYSLIQKAMKLIQTPHWLGTYMNTNKGITDKNRNALTSTVTFVYAIINYHIIKQRESNPSKRKSMWSSFRAQAAVLNEPIGENDHNRINTFLEYLNRIINEVYRIHRKQNRERVGTWNNFAKQTGMILHEWLENENASAEVKKLNQEKWIELMILERKSGDLMFKGRKTMWNGMLSKLRQNTDDVALAARLERVNEFYANKEAIADEHGIIYSTEENNNDSDESTDNE